MSPKNPTKQRSRAKSSSPAAASKPMAAEPPRCHWARNDLAIVYHDTEWGVPQHDDRVLFEFLILEGAQAGLSWDTILQKRAHYREVYDQFDPAKVARYDVRKQAKLLADPGIIRNRLKVASSIQNAKLYLRVQDEFSSFDSYLWRFVGGKPIVNRPRLPDDVPACTALSDALSKDLTKRGFRFVGSTICYAYMQAIGMVNDHHVNCFRRKQVQQKS
jgi:DNA-3-methyladenine glycosylase I